MLKNEFKALFIAPSQKKVYNMKILPSYPPLGLLYVASSLENIGVNVRVLDVDIDGLRDNQILSFIKEFKPNLIGITAITPTVKEAFRLADVIKISYDTKIVLGGIHPTMNPEECIRHDSVDFVVKGEGEGVIKELVYELASNGRDFNKIRGLLYKNGKDFYFTGERDLISDLDSVSFPSRHLLNGFSRYRPPDAEHLPVASILTTRGCPGRCAYCCTNNLFRNRYRTRSIDNVIKEIDEIIGRFKVKEIHIADDAFNIDKKRVMEFSEAVKKRNYKVNFEFLNGLRADMIDQEMLDAFKLIGIKNVGFGAESADKDILKRVKKNIMPEDVERAVRLAKRNGLKTWAFFMIGLPGETEASIKKTIKFAEKIDPDFAKFLIFKPFPGTEIYNDIKIKGCIDSFDFDQYGVYTPPVHHLEGLSGADMLRWQKAAFKQFYFRPGKIWAHIIRQRSISQLKLSLRGFIFVCFNAFNLKKDC